MDQKEARILCKDLLETGWPVYLTTIDAKGYPQTRAMLNLRNKKQYPNLFSFFEKQDDFTIIFTTNTSSTKITDVKTNSAISVYYCDPESWRGVMFGGDVEIVDDLSFKQRVWSDSWTKYYPKGYDDPDHTVLRMNPIMVKGWTGSMTFELELGDTQ
ncbi:hypothetical protein E4H12_11560 [Candidatus Thorarchaeota archaeon]|nr:MAG: hypothetical protein E4H12_11560 [Candidatus Thorarchaeota archaeon]